MRKLITIIGIFLSNVFLFSQNNNGVINDFGRLSLAAYVPEQIEEITPGVKANLKNKLNQIITKHGLGSDFLSNRFILTANINVLTKDITATAPSMYSYTLDVTFFIGDGIDGVLFSSINSTVKGVGETETKAYLSALKNIKTDDLKFKSFIEDGKNKIIEYYNTKCDFILKEAEVYSNKGEYDAAIYKLLSVPDVCKACYNKAMEAVLPIYRKQIDAQCKSNYSSAVNIWNSNPNEYGAEKAAEFLSNIDPNSNCYKQALNFSNQIGNRLKEIDNREWNFRLRQQENDARSQIQTIKAIRDIGVAYGSHQPNIHYNIRGWW